MPDVKYKLHYYHQPKYWFASAFMPLSLPLVYAAYRYWKRRLPIDPNENDIILGRYFKSIQYIATENNGKVTQRWIVNKSSEDRAILNNPSKTAIDTKKANYRYCESLNLNGIKSTFGKFYFSKRISFKLSPEGDTSEISFTVSDWQRYKELWRKCKLVCITDYIKPALSTKEWNNAYFRHDLVVGIGGLNHEERQELLALTNRKLEYTKLVTGKDVLSQNEVFYRYFMTKVPSPVQAYGEYIYEFQMEDAKANLLPQTAQHREVLGDIGVHVGGNWFFKGQGHFLTIGKTRGGKGTNLIIPQLLNPELFPGSVVALDIKGTLAAICTRYLREVAGKNVVIIDPWKIQEKIGASHNIKSSSINPLDALDENDPNFIDDCDEMAELIVSFDKSKEGDSHWVERARQWVSYYLIWMTTSMSKGQRTLSKLRELFNYDQEERIRLFATMEVHGKYDLIVQNAKQMADIFKSAPKEAQSILSTVLRAIDLFKSPVMEEATAKSDFDIRDLTSGNYYVFVIIPPDRLGTHFRWLRTVLGGMMTAVVRNADKRVLMLLDEFPALGKLNLVKKGMGTMAEYNLSLWIIAQGIEQLKEIYGSSWETFVTNSAVSTWISVEGNESPEYLARLMGTRHIHYKPDSIILSELKQNTVLAPEKYEIQAQTPVQIRQSNSVYTLISGMPPLSFDKRPYYTSEFLMDRADPNPYYKGD